MAATIDDVIEAAANGVIRALEARKAGRTDTAAAVSDVSTEGLVRSGFIVGFHIIAGGITPELLRGTLVALNPQPLPPKE